MAKKKYIPSGSAPFGKKDAQVVGEHLETLMKKLGGELTTDAILEDAKKKRSILHKYFDWDDTTAAHQYRLQQARHIISGVVEVTVIDNENQNVRSFYNVSKSKGRNVYVTLQTAIKEPDYLEQLVNDAKDSMKQLQNTLSLFLTYHSQEYKKKSKAKKK